MSHAGSPATRLARFWSKVVIAGDDDCWRWIGSIARGGYGQLDGLRAHRISYEVHRGPIPSGHFVCHRCDQRDCVNPRHLFAGPPAANTADMLAKGRHVHGERVCTAKLTAAQVLAMRLEYREGVVQTELARRYGVSQPHISDIVMGRAWRHLPGAWTEAP